MEPEEVVFSAASTGFDVVIAVKEDAIPESGQTFAVGLTPPEDTPAMIGEELSVIVPADNDTTMVSIFAERTVIPEGAATFALIDADINRDVTFSMTVSGLMSVQTRVSFSHPP